MIPDPTDVVTDVVWPLVTQRFGTILVQSVQDLVEGAEEDLRTFGLAIARNTVLAIVSRDEEWLSELRGQAQGLLEINRIRVSNESRELVLRILESLVRMAMQAALGAATATMFKLGNLDEAQNLLGLLK